MDENIVLVSADLWSIPEQPVLYDTSENVIKVKQGYSLETDPQGYLEYAKSKRACLLHGKTEHFAELRGRINQIKHIVRNRPNVRIFADLLKVLPDAKMEHWLKSQYEMKGW